MNLKPKHDRTFWLIFVPFFVASSFIPVLPLYMGPAGDVLMWVIPIWAIYASLFVMPEWILFSVPVVFTHTATTYLISQRLARIRQNPIRFSLLSMLAASSLLALCIALIVAYADVGFCMFFLACLLTATIANFRNWDSVAGLPVPKMNQTIQIASAIICAVMLVFGIPIAIVRIAE